MPFRIVVILSVLFFITSYTFSQSTEIITGNVSDGNKSLQGAIVKWQASSEKVITDNKGNFELKKSGKSNSDLISAWKNGYFNGGTVYKEGSNNIKIVLSPLYFNDNKNYNFVDPVPNLTDVIKNCGDCHSSIIYKQWSNNSHAKSASNPLFFDLYNGTDASGNKKVQPGYKIDYEYSNGNCGNCHAPAAAINNFNNVDMNNLTQAEKLGVSCDFCHKVKDVKLNLNSSVFTGVMNYEMLRPPEDHQIFFGPYTDVLDPDVYSEKFSQSLFCAPCHRGGYWGIPIYDSYDQWANSQYAKEGVSCQDCHMTPDGKTTNFAPGKGGVERDPKTIYTHILYGSRDSAFIASAVKLSVKVAIKKGNAVVDVVVENTGAGHHIPTDQPMRNILLVVRAFDSKGKELKYNGKNIIPFWGGRGNVKDGNYEGYPGKGFAKILFEDWTQYERIKVGPKSQQIYPAPQWRTVKIKYDTRIPAMGQDKSKYEFELNKTGNAYTVVCSLIYRRTFKSWAQMKNWNLKDLVIAEKKLEVKK